MLAVINVKINVFLKYAIEESPTTIIVIIISHRLHPHQYMHPCPQRFLVFNVQATFLLGFLLNLASGFLWQGSGHPIVLVAQESKLCSGESKTSNIFIIACVQAIWHSFGA